MKRKQGDTFLVTIHHTARRLHDVECPAGVEQQYTEQPSRDYERCSSSSGGNGERETQDKHSKGTNASLLVQSAKMPRF